MVWHILSFMYLAQCLLHSCPSLVNGQPKMDVTYWELTYDTDYKCNGNDGEV